MYAHTTGVHSSLGSVTLHREWMALQEPNVACCSNNRGFSLGHGWKAPSSHQNTPLISFISKQNLLSAVDFTVEVLLRDEWHITFMEIAAGSQDRHKVAPLAQRAFLPFLLQRTSLFPPPTSVVLLKDVPCLSHILWHSRSSREEKAWLSALLKVCF